MIRLLTVLCLAAGFSATAQKYELGEVTKQELEEKSHPLDPSAGAAILFSKGETSMAFTENTGFTLVTEVEVKIKIYNKEGYEWANKAISYYVAASDKESVDISKAVTYNLADGAIKKTKLKSEGEFTEEANKYWKQKKIVMPDVKEGSIVEYKYTIRSPFVHIFPEWRFQESIPVNYSQYTTRIPEYFMYNPLFRGYHHPKVTKSTQRKSYTFTSKERTGVRVSKTNFTTNSIEYTEETIKYVIENLPAMKNEQYVNNIDNYTASIEHELSMTRYPNEPTKSYSSTWEAIVKTIYDYDSFGPELRKTGYFEKDIDALLAGAGSKSEKAAIIFNYVKNRMNWNGYFGYSCDAGVKKAYADKTGNTAEINLMLTAMLRYSGIVANPVLVSTRSNKIALYPSRTSFNYVIAAVEIDGNTILLDATSKAALPDILPVRSLNWEGRIIRNDGSSGAVSLMPRVNSKEIINIAAQLDNMGKLTGKVRDQYFDHNALSFREMFAGISKESYIEKLERHYKGIEIKEYKVSHDDLSKPVVEEFEFEHDGLSDVIGDKIYISPMLFFAQAENPFKMEKREYPIDFVFPRQDKYMINITLPEGYVVESLPVPLNLVMEENIGNFKYNLASNNNTLQLVVTLDINYPTIPQDYYKTIQDFYQKMGDKQGEKIVLKKL